MKMTIKLLQRSLVLVVAIAAVLFSAYYLTHSHSELASFYLDIYPDFYKSEIWQSTFFTEQVKLGGDKWCQAAIAISIFWILLTWNINFGTLPKWRIDKKSLIDYTIIIVGGLILASISNLSTFYAYDEVFSAVNFASIPKFQGMSYFILPNNHLFYNVLNRTLFFWADDLVATGRFISMVSYILVLLMSWKFLKLWINNASMRWVLLLSLALQFPAWGFSAQARGYELILFFSIFSLYCFWNYWLNNKTYLLLPMIISLVLGMFTLASFLYWLIGLSIASLLFMMDQKKLDWKFIRFMSAGLCVLFILYLPLLSFSGLTSMTDNQYMKATASTSLEFIPFFFTNSDYFRRLFTEWFCFDILSRVPGYFLLLLPVFALLNKWNDKPFKPLLKLYFSIIFAFIIVCIVMKNMAFSRNMIAHGYFIWMVLLIVLSTLPKRLIFQKGFIVLIGVSTVFSTIENYKFLPYGLYYYNVDEKYESLRSCHFEPKLKSSILLDNESFYWWYVLNKKFPEHQLDIVSNRTKFNTQDYVIALKEDSTYYKNAYKQSCNCSEFIILEKK